MSFIDVTAFLNRILQQVSDGANHAGTWTRGQLLNIRRKRPKSATADTTATTSTTTQKTNGESSKQSKQKSKEKKTKTKQTELPKHKRTRTINSPSCYRFSHSAARLRFTISSFSNNNPHNSKRKLYLVIF